MIPGLAAIVLAAGAASRFEGGAKLQREIAGNSILGWALDAVTSAGIDDVIVVADLHDRATQELAAARGARLVLNPAPEGGLGRSLACGVAALVPATRGVFVCLGDMPFVRRATYRLMIERFGAGDGTLVPPDIVAPACHGRRGNPVLFGPRFYAALGRLDGDRGARRLLAAAGAALTVVETGDPGVVTDIDTLADLAAAQALIDQLGRSA